MTVKDQDSKNTRMVLQNPKQHKRRSRRTHVNRGPTSQGGRPETWQDGLSHVAGLRERPLDVRKLEQVHQRIQKQVRQRIQKQVRQRTSTTTPTATRTNKHREKQTDK